VILWLPRQEHRRESQPGLRVFDHQRITPMTLKVRLARVFHRQRVTPIAAKLRLAQDFHRGRLDELAVNLWLARVLHRPRVTHSASSEAMICPRL
jgi:hypothetical protein